MIEPWMYKKYWDKIENEPQDIYHKRKKALIGDYLSIIRQRGLPIVLRKDFGIEIVYSKEHEFLSPAACDICYFTKCKVEKKIHMVRILDPDYPEGLISKNTFGVMWKCKCSASVSKLKLRFKHRSSKRKEEAPEINLPYKEPEEEEEIPF